MGWFRRLDDLLARMEKGLVVICFLLLVAFVIIGILSRNFFHLSSGQLFESAPALVLWMALLGASLAVKQQRHIRLELFLRYVGRPLRNRIGRAVNLFGAMVMGILLVASFEFVKGEVAMFGAKGWLAIIFPLFFATTCVRYLGAATLGAETRPVSSAPGERPTP